MMYVNVYLGFQENPLQIRSKLANTLILMYTDVCACMSMYDDV
jgi:hypothetical protein